MTYDVFIWGDLVKYKDEIMIVSEENEYGENKIGLSRKNTPFIKNKYGKNFKKINYYSIKNVKKLPEVIVNKNIVKSFFRLESDIWQLAEDNSFPFYSNSEVYEFSDNDLEAFCNNVKKVESYVFKAWERAFGYNYKLAVPYIKKENSIFNLKYLWEIFNKIFFYFDFEEDDLNVFSEYFKAYKANKGKKLTEIDVPNDLKYEFIELFEKKSRNEGVSKEEKNAYVVFLDDLCDANHYSAVKTKSYAYYTGNKIVSTDWKKSEEALLKLYKFGEMKAANSLGYIYYSKRLGQPDYDKAFFFFSKAAEDGIIEATYKLSDMYRKGHGTAKNIKKAWSLLGKVYREELEKIKGRIFDCKYADIALRMGYFYEEGLLQKQDYHRALEYFLRAKFALEMRQMRYSSFGDSKVLKKINEAIERVSSKNNNDIFKIYDLPGFPGTAYKKLNTKQINYLEQTIDNLFNTVIDNNTDNEIDDDDNEEEVYKTDMANELFEKYDDEAIFEASFKWLKNNSTDYKKISNFLKMFYYHFCDLVVSNPYPFLGYLYNKYEESKEELDFDLCLTIIFELLKKSGYDVGYCELYEPNEDIYLQKEMKRYKSN